MPLTNIFKTIILEARWWDQANDEKARDCFKYKNSKRLKIKNVV